ncbi:FxLD family lantipeptide [Streptomyces sp. ME19-01-6]|nr:FxLD family lantipeptide [Streptomyces sp. ME19-01-6]MDX3224727.1 FxLD family lantipeptide [Streptomyces sp. ME19-01-6]
MNTATTDENGDAFVLDVIVTTDVSGDAIPCGTDDGCDPTCASSCNSSV